MLYLLSPAKSLDYDSPIDADLLSHATQPAFVAQAAELIRGLRKLKPEQIAELMELSMPLAQLNGHRYLAWSRRHDIDNSRPACLAFNGDVYEGLSARTLKPADLLWAQEHLVILSGLYGALRPLDLIHAYRLEMGTRFGCGKAGDLYEYWSDALSDYLHERLHADKTPTIVNLASQEYFKAARRLRGARVIECVFEDWKTDQYKVISFYAKRARGMMARFAVERRISHPLSLTQFSSDGYTHDVSASTPERLVFRRRAKSAELAAA